jgi:ribosomal-protein-alanine N-acetyltransferase
MSNLVLRPWQKPDAQQLAAVANNRNIWNQVRDALPSPYTVLDALQWIAHVEKQQPPMQFAMVYDGKVAGSIGATPKTDIEKRTAEIGYFVGEPFWGKGIATEAVRLLVEYLSAQTELVRLESLVFEGNKASMKVLEKNGFRLEAIHEKAAYKNHVLLNQYRFVKLI